MRVGSTCRRAGETEYSPVSVRPLCPRLTRQTVATKLMWHGGSEAEARQADRPTARLALSMNSIFRLPWLTDPTAPTAAACDVVALKAILIPMCMWGVHSLSFFCGDSVCNQGRSQCLWLAGVGVA